MVQTALLILTIAVGSQPDKAASAEEKEQVERWMTMYERVASEYDIRFSGDMNARLELQPEPVLRWTNPVIGNGSTHGACFVWTHEGRPEVFASIFSFIPTRSPTQDQRWLSHAFNSLSPRALVARRNDERFWFPTKSGLDLQPAPGAPEPAQSRPLRLIQMRNLAREFRATSTLNDNIRELRLLSQPLYRYSGLLKAETDGALFCFVTGTDPELLLVIESHETTGGSEWRYAGARHSGCTLHLYHQQKEVWNYVRGGPHTKARDPKHRYLSVHGISVFDKDIPYRRLSSQ